MFLHFILLFLATKDDSQIIPHSSHANDVSENDVELLEESVSEDTTAASNNASESQNQNSNELINTSVNSESEINNESNGPERTLKVISMGAPVPTSIKPNLPPLENWAVGMGELLYFENLPTSTGTYKGKMKGILGKIRNRFSKTDEEENEE